MDDLIKIGKVVSNNLKNKTVRVQFADNDNVVSYDLHMIFRRTSRDKDCGGLPDIGENAVCLFLPNGDEVGFIIGTFYNEAIPSPDNSQSKVIHWITATGAEIFLDRDSNELVATGVSKATIQAKESIEATAPNIIVNGDTIINGDLKVAGTTEMEGMVTMKEGATINNINFDKHGHGGIQRGNGVSDTPQSVGG